jgi:hypothetical protein
MMMPVTICAATREGSTSTVPVDSTSWKPNVLTSEQADDLPGTLARSAEERIRCLREVHS